MADLSEAESSSAASSHTIQDQPSSHRFSQLIVSISSIKKFVISPARDFVQRVQTFYLVSSDRKSRFVLVDTHRHVRK